MDVLLVEDNWTARSLFQHLLEAEGCHVYACESAEAAWEAYQAFTFPLLIVDWMLPGMTGLEFCRLVRTTPAGAYAYIMVITALTGADALREVLEAGADDYLSKPVTNEHFQIRLQIASRRAQHNQQRRQAEEKQHLLAAALEHAEDGVLITDANLEKPGPQIVFSNASMTRMTGYTQAQLLGQTPRILQGPETNRVVLDQLKAELEAGRHFTAETTNYRSDGSTFQVWWQIAPIRNTAGLITHFISIQRDVSKDRKVEQEMMQVNDTQIQQIGRDLHDSIGQYLTGMSFLVASLQRTVSSPETTTLVQHLQETLHETKNLVRHVARGLTPTNIEEAPLPELLGDLVLLLRSTSPLQCAATLDERSATLPPFIKLHLYRIAQEALNNASRHSQATHVSVRLAYEKHNHLSLEIEDNGKGLPPQGQHEGLGFRTMHYRARTMNASLQIESPTSRGAGTCIRCVVALPADVSL